MPTLAQLVGIGVLRAEEVSAMHRTILSHKVYESVPIKLQMDEEEMARFAIHRFQFSGVDIHPRLARHYPLKEIGVHAIGYVSAINDEDLKTHRQRRVRRHEPDRQARASSAPTRRSCTASRAFARFW